MGLLLLSLMELMMMLQMKTAVRELTSRVTQLAGAFGLGHRLTPGTSDRPTPLALAA